MVRTTDLTKLAYLKEAYKRVTKINERSMFYMECARAMAEVAKTIPEATRERFLADRLANDCFELQMLAHGQIKLIKDESDKI